MNASTSKNLGCVYFLYFFAWLAFQSFFLRNAHECVFPDFCPVSQSTHIALVANWHFGWIGCHGLLLFLRTLPTWLHYLWHLLLLWSLIFTLANIIYFSDYVKAYFFDVNVTGLQSVYSVCMKPFYKIGRKTVHFFGPFSGQIFYSIRFILCLFIGFVSSATPIILMLDHIYPLYQFIFKCICHSF